VEAGENDRAAEKKGRSGVVHRLHATEMAFWGAAQETMGAVMLSVPATGEIVIESTPNGAGGLYYDMVQAARAGTSGYKLHFFAWWQHNEYRGAIPADFDPEPRDQWEQRLRGYGCDDAQIVWWRSKVNDPSVGLDRALVDFAIDVDTCFRASGSPWIEPAVIDKISDRVREPVRLAPLVWRGQRFDAARIYQERRAGLQYVVFADVAEGVAGDGSAACVLERASGEMVATWWSDSIAPGDFGAVLAILGWLYSDVPAKQFALVGCERNNHGHATLERLLTVMRYPAVYHADDGRPGWDTNSATRPVMWDGLAYALRDGAAWTPDAATLGECKTIVRDVDGKPRARGKHGKSKEACRDDRFVAWAGAWQLRSRAAPVVGGARVSGI
jgi:hypothetical protein